MDRGGQSYLYHTDGLGSITEVTDISGAIIASYTYDSFGKILARTGSLTNPYTYTAREYDNESGLYYYRARYYDPRIGRFLQPDPLDMVMVILIRQYYPGSPIGRLLYKYFLNNPQSVFNIYLYVNNNPIRRIDPLGLWYIDINASLGYWGGGTWGVMIGPRGIYPYAGGGAVTPWGGVALTWSPQNPTPGWNVGLQAGYWIGFQRGYTFGKEGGWFTEFGFVTPGASLTGYHVWDPWKWPWKKDEEKDKCE